MTASKDKVLQGVRVLVTRAARQASALSDPLRELGAEVLEVPTIEIVAPESYEPLDRALRAIRSYKWLILTSVNGVEVLFERCRQIRVPVEEIKHLQIAAIGPATRDAIEEQGLRVSVMPERYVAESVVEALRRKTRGQRVLLVRAKVARDVLPNELRAAGADVEVIDAYETRVPDDAAQRLREVFSSAAKRPQFVTLTSSSTAINFLHLLASDAAGALQGVKLVSIGPVTSATLKQAGFDPAIEAEEYTMRGVVESIARIAKSAKE